MTFDLPGLLRVLAEHEVDFIVVGGIAGATHGAARATYDLDIVYSRSSDNIARLARALAPLAPYLRGAPPGLPFRFDADTITRGLNFTLTTTLGSLDLLGEITGGGRYEDLLPATEEHLLFAHPCRIVSLPRLIELKRAAGRPRDLDAVAELEALLEERERSG